MGGNAHEGPMCYSRVVVIASILYRYRRAVGEEHLLDLAVVKACRDEDMKKTRTVEEMLYNYILSQVHNTHARFNRSIVT